MPGKVVVAVPTTLLLLLRLLNDDVDVDDDSNNSNPLLLFAIFEVVSIVVKYPREFDTVSKDMTVMIHAVHKSISDIDGDDDEDDDDDRFVSS